MYHEVNRLGWEGVEWGNAYLNVSGFLKSVGAENRIRDAIKRDIYDHTCTMKVQGGLEGAFAFGNGHGEGEWIMRDEPKSVSVGDVLIDADMTNAWVCLSVGWKTLGREFMKEFQTRVATSMMNS